MVTAYVFLAYLIDSTEAAVWVGIVSILPLACIWFGDTMGGYTGAAGTIGITQESPGALVCLLGWVLMLLPLVVGVLYAL